MSHTQQNPLWKAFSTSPPAGARLKTTQRHTFPQAAFTANALLDSALLCVAQVPALKARYFASR